MDKTSWFRVCAVSLVFLGGCSSLPASKVHYYLPASALTVELDRVVGCDKEHHIRVADAVTTSVSNTADRKLGPMTFDLTKQHSQFADSDITFEFTKDSRLSSVNAVSTGQGGAIIKTIGLMAMTAVATALDGGDKPFDTACNAINNGDGKPVTIVYKQTFTGAKLAKGDPEGLVPDAESAYFAKNVNPVLGSPLVKISEVAPLSPPIIPADGNSDGKVKIPSIRDTLPQDVIYARVPRFVQIEVTASGGAKYVSGTNPNGDTSIGKVSAVVAGDGDLYAIPVQKPRAFGYKKVAASFDDNGGLTKIEYAANAGAVSSLDAFNALLADRAGLDAAEAKAINDKTDILVANRRRITCETGSSDCK
jgi:hypothetical protein